MSLYLYKLSDNLFRSNLIWFEMIFEILLFCNKYRFYKLKAQIYIWLAPWDYYIYYKYVSAKRMFFFLFYIFIFVKFWFWPYSFISFIYFYFYCPICEYRTSCAMVYMGRLKDNVWQSIISYPLGFWHLISGDQTCSACAFIYWTILPALLLFFSGVGCFYNFVQMTPKTRKKTLFFHCTLLLLIF